MTDGNTMVSNRRAGQPLLVLVALLAFWIGGRSLLWQSPFPVVLPSLDLPELFATKDAPEIPVESIAEAGHLVQRQRIKVGRGQSIKPALSVPLPWQSLRYSPYARPAKPPMMLASHQAMWMSAMSSVPVPPELADLIAPAASRQNAVPSLGTALPDLDAASGDRWSFDSWLFLRPTSIRNSGVGPLPSTYGASQAGGVLRFKLSPANHHRPTAYARMTKALAGTKESSAALGMSARPIPGVPLATYAEIRVTQIAGMTEVRPAAFVVTEFPPQKLPLGVRATAYGQAGYVGGNFASSFVDGQGKIDREVASFDLATFRAGAGVWGGAQRDAARLDVGPTASVDITIGKAPVRVSVDYRHRIAGDAEPQSGIAITLSTGF